MKTIASLAFVLLAALITLAAVGPTALAQDFGGDQVVLGQNYTLRSGETLDGNLTVLGGTAVIEPDATVLGDVSVAGGVLTVDGRITGNLSLVGGSVRLNETAVVEGDLASFAGSVEQAPGSEVRGNILNGLRTPPQIQPAPVVPDIVRSETPPRSWFARFVGWQLGTIGSILLMGLLGIVMMLVAPRAVGRVASATAMQPALTFGLGFLTLVVGALAGAILLIACGLGLLVWLALIAAGVLGWIGVALWLGQRILRALKLHTASAVGEVLTGVVVITFLARLPWCFGWLAWLIFVSWGLGAVVLTRFGTQDSQDPNRRVIQPPDNDPGLGTGGPVYPLSSASDLPRSEDPFENAEARPVDLEPVDAPPVLTELPDDLPPSQAPVVDEPPLMLEPPDPFIEPAPDSEADAEPPPTEPGPKP